MGRQDSGGWGWHARQHGPRQRDKAPGNAGVASLARATPLGRAILASMILASVILDVPTQSLDAPYTYAVADTPFRNGDDGYDVSVGCARRRDPRQAEGRGACAVQALLRRGRGRLRAVPLRRVPGSAVGLHPPVHPSGRRAAHRARAWRVLAPGAAGGGRGGRPLGHPGPGGRGIRAAQGRDEAAGRPRRAALRARWWSWTA